MHSLASLDLVFFHILKWVWGGTAWKDHLPRVAAFTAVNGN
jgi:hypothetical protein